MRGLVSIVEEQKNRQHTIVSFGGGATEISAAAVKNDKLFL